VMNYNINAQQWYVNVDIMNKGSVCIRTAATTEYWHIIMGTVTRDPASRSLILDPGAAENVFDIYPPLFRFDGYENNSGEWNNVFRMVPQNPPRGWSPMSKTHLVPVLSVFNDGPMDPKSSQEYNRLTQLKLYHQEGLISDEEYASGKEKMLSNLLQ